MKRYLLPLAVAFSLLMLSGCTDEDANDPVVYSTAEVEGNWTAIQDTAQNQVITHTTWDHVTIADYGHFEMKQTYKIVGEKTIQPNNLTVRKIEKTYVGNFATYALQNFVDTANSTVYCGYDDWEANVTKDTTGCNGGVPAGVVLKDIYYIDGDLLSMGDFNQMGTDMHPEALDTSYTYQKQ